MDDFDSIQNPNEINKDINNNDATSFDYEIKRLKKEVELRDNQIDTLKKTVEGKKDSAILQQKINELTTYNEDLKKFQLDKDFQINELNKILENKEKEILSLKEKNRNENPVDLELKSENERLQRDINKLNGRLNDLEIKMYKANDDKSILEKQNKEFIDKINNFEAELEERMKNKEEELIDLRNKITELETNIDEKEETIKILEERLNSNEESIMKLNEEDVKKEEIIRQLKLENEKFREKGSILSEEKLEENDNIIEKEKEQIKEDEKINIDDYVLKSIHEEILEEKQLEINTLINTINVTRKEKEELETKISNMKNSVSEINQRLEIEMEKHANNSEEKSEMILRETKLTESLQAAEEKISKMKIIIKTISKEKTDLEELILKQENKVSDLAAKIKIVEKNIKEKNKEISENEENTMKLINILEEQKKQIENLTKNQASNMNNKIVLSTKDEVQLKKVIADKDNEITTLKLYNDNLKTDNHTKDQNIAAMQKTLSRYQEEIKRLKLAKLELTKNNENNKEKENDNKNNANTGAKLLNKKIKLEAKDLNKDNDNNAIENVIKNKLNNKKLLLEKNQENQNSDLKLPDINKNQRNLGLNKKNSGKDKERYDNEDLNYLYKEKESDNPNTNGVHHRKQISNKNYSDEYKNKEIIDNQRINHDYEQTPLNEKKIKYSSKKKIKRDEEKIKNNNLDTSSNIQNLEEENEININEISNMMKKILSDENQII